MKASTRFAATTAATALVVIGLAVFLGLISYRHQVRKDVTKNARHSLAPQTVKVLEELQAPVALTFFIKDGDPSKDAVLRLLDLYRYHSDQFAFELIDPERNRARAEGYKLDQYGIPVAFFEREDGTRESVTGIGGIESLQALEELLTNGLIKATRGQTKTIYMLAGHGEAGLEGADQYRAIQKARGALEDKSYAVKELQLFGQERVPRDCDVLVIAGPRKELHPTELQAVRRYLERGGRAFVALDPQTSQGLAAAMAEFGVVVGNDVVIEFNILNQLAAQGGPLTPIAAQYAQHAITRNFSLATYFPETRSVSVGSSPIDAKPVPLVLTSAETLAKTNMEEVRQGLETGRVTLRETDRRGPISVAAVSTWQPQAISPTGTATPAADASGQEHEMAGSATDEEDASAEDAAESVAADEQTAAEEDATNEGRLVVFGDSDFLTDQHFEQLGNSDMFLNAVNWLAQEEDLIALRPKTSDAQYVTLTTVQAQLVFWLPVVLLPGLVLFAGGVVWWRRSRFG